MSRSPLALLIGVLIVAGAACGDTSAGTITSVPSSAAISTTAAPADPVTVLTTTAAPAGAFDLELEILERIPHATDAFTQGFLLDDGRLFESTGLLGASTLREVDPSSGEVLRQVAVDPNVFAEGLALVGDRLIQLSWRAGTADVYDRDTFELVETFTYEGEGWGLCHDGARLIMSDGSATLTMRNPSSFEVIETVQVRRDGLPVERINELECVGDAVWANVWQTDDIIRIDPATGMVTGVVDASGLHRSNDANDVLNGIAHDEATGEFLITGKRWPEMFRVRFSG